MEFVIWFCSIAVYVFHHCLLSESISEDWVDLKIKAVGSCIFEWFPILKSPNEYANLTYQIEISKVTCF